jgi:hypothetical protein
VKCTPARYTLKNVLGVRHVRFRFRWPGRFSLDRISLDRISLDRISWSRGALLASAVAAAACGRRATLDDCRLIVDRSVELQMRQMSLIDPSAIRKREDDVRAALQIELASCEGRRVTDRTISCVQRANTLLDLDQCLR